MTFPRTDMTPEQFAELTRAIRMTALAFARRREWLDVRDLEQHCWVELLARLPAVLAQTGGHVAPYAVALSRKTLQRYAGAQALMVRRRSHTPAPADAVLPQFGWVPVADDAPARNNLDCEILRADAQRQERCAIEAFHAWLHAHVVSHATPTQAARARVAVRVLIGECGRQDAAAQVGATPQQISETMRAVRNRIARSANARGVLQQLSSARATLEALQ